MEHMKDPGDQVQPEAVWPRPISKILFATDYSEASELALELASQLALASGALMQIVHVTQSELHPIGELFNEPPRPDPREVAQLESVRPSNAEVRCEHHLLFGEPGSTEITKPGKVILDMAEKMHPDLIVLGTHGRSGLSSAIIGSVATAVLRGAHCPVLVAKPWPGSAWADRTSRE